MGVSLSHAVALAALTALAACATTPPPRIAFHPESFTGVHRVVIVYPGPTRIVFVSGISSDLARGSSGQGAILLLPFMLAAMAHNQVKGDELDTRLKAVPFDFADALSEALAAKLAASGYEVSRQSAARPTSDDIRRTWIDDYRPWIGTSDAVLDFTAARVGYLASSSLTDYVPLAYVCARLVLPSSRRIVFRECYSYGEVQHFPDTTQILPIGEVRFGTFDELVAQATKAAEGLRLGARAIAGELAVDLGP